jgi:hypothetical protein
MPVLCVSLLAGCSTPLQQYIVAHRYEPFEIPRDTDGVGTVISLRDGREVTIAREDECLAELAAAARASPRKVALESYQYTIHRDDRLELRLPHVLQPGLRLEAAATHDAVRAIQIRLAEPFEMLVSVKRIVDEVPWLEGTCRELVLDEEHFIITQVLGAGGIEYEFLDEHGVAVAVDANLLGRIGADAELSRRFEGRRALAVDFPVLIGYRLMRARELPGIAERYACTPVAPGTIRRLKVRGAS